MTRTRLDPAHPKRLGNPVRTGAAWIALAAVLGGCAAVPPRIPDLVTPPHARFLDGASAPAGAQAYGVWWDGFASPELRRLLSLADAGSLDVQMAGQRLSEAQSGRVQAASGLWPSLTLGGAVSDERTGLPERVKQGSPDTRAIRGAGEAAWEVDVSGGVRASVDAAGWQALAAEDAVQVARWVLRAEVARQYLIWQGARLKLDALERLLQTREATLRLTASRLQAGQGSRFDLSRADGEAGELRTRLPPLRALVRVTEFRLAVLSGVAPGRLDAFLDRSTPPALPGVQPIPTGWPVDLLRRRPDLRVAEHQWRAEAARLRVAEAELWPRFFLSAVLGGQDLRLNGLDLSPSRISSVALAFRLPVFNAGRLRAAVDAQNARQREASLRYERSVLQALGEVESAREALRHGQVRTQALDDTLILRQTSLRQAQALQREGQIDLLQLLDVQRAVLAAEIEAIDGHQQLALGALDLFNALGGGQPDSTPTTGQGGQP